MADPESEQLEQSVSETEDALLESAFAEPEETPEADKPADNRDPATGRFTKKADAEQPAQTAPAEPAKAGEPEKPDEQVPSWRLREINEEKRRVEAERDALRAEHARLQAAWAQQQRSQAPKEAPPPPDPVLDPAAYTKYVQDGLRAEFQAQVAHDRLNMNLEMANLRHGERFEKAFEALVVEGQRGNSQLVRQLISQANPGAAIMRWHTQNEVLREVGSDPAEYQKKLRESLLNDPEFLAAAQERARSIATGGGQPNRANTVVTLPPSLSKATGSGEVPTNATDGSEEGLFNFAMTSKRRGGR